MKTTISTFVLLFTVSMGIFAQQGSEWVDKVYSVRGHWSINEEGEDYYFRLGSDFNTLAGPELKLYLSPLPMDAINDRDAIDRKKGVFIAELESNKGSQQYKLPDTVQLSNYKSIVIFCRKFSVVWGGVDLEE